MATLFYVNLSVNYFLSEQRKLKNMILPTLSEAQISEELKNDYQWIKVQLKKVKQRLENKLRKADLVKGERVYEMELTSPANNKWYVQLNLNLQREPQSHIYCHCIAESEHGTLNYYMLRGLTFGGEYFVKVTAHTIKRIKERLPNFELLTSNQVCSHLFQYRECGSAMKLTDLRFLSIVEDSPDSKDVSLLVITQLGIFLAYHTPGNNVIFKTFISVSMLHRDIEREVYGFCLAGYVLQNTSLFPQDIIMYSLERCEEFKAKYHRCPTGMSLDA